MYYNITIFSQFVVAPTRCIISAIDSTDGWENFSQHYNAIKSIPVCNVDELVISNTSGYNCNNYKLNNNLA